MSTRVLEVRYDAQGRSIEIPSDVKQKVARLKALKSEGITLVKDERMMRNLGESRYIRIDDYIAVFTF